LPFFNKKPTALLRKHRKGSCNTSRLSTSAKKSRVWVALYATTRQPTGCRGYLEAMATTSERIYWEDPAAPSSQRLFPSIQIFLLHMASAPSFEHSNLANNFFASSCDSRRPIICFATFHLPGSSWPSVNSPSSKLARASHLGA